jgi:hypothetical protein
MEAAMRTFLRRQLLVVGFLMLVIAAAPVSAHSARAAASTNWFGWGIKLRFVNSQPSVTYVAYIGTDSPAPQVLKSRGLDISSSCTTVGAVSYPSSTTARFDGPSYIACALPSARDELAQLGYTPPSGDNPFAACTIGGGPYWVDANIKSLPAAAGTYPLYDLSDLGLRTTVQTTGSQVRMALQAATSLQTPAMFSTYNSPYWAAGASTNHVVMGWYGKGIVAVANRFNWLDYLANPGWQTFYNNSVTGAKLGYWYEAPVAQQPIPTTGSYELGMKQGTLYIGYSPASGAYFTGDLVGGGIEPGCKG